MTDCVLHCVSLVLYAEIHMTSPANTPVSCPKKAKLVALYQHTTRTYADAVAELNQRMGTSSKTEYEAIFRMAEQARVNAISAREALKKHTDEHGC
jgi:hypothetical protein